MSANAFASRPRPYRPGVNALHVTSDQPAIPAREFLNLWWQVAILSFGGPAAQIGVMQRLIVDDKQWLPQEEFNHALNFCMLLPGPEAQQLATYIGWRLKGVRGGLAAGILFVVPGALVMLGLSLLYVTVGQTGFVEGLLFGLKCAVLAIVAQALLRMAGKVVVFSEGYRKLGWCYLRLGETQEARRVLEQLLEREPDDATALLYVGLSHAHEGAAEKAVTVWQHVHDYNRIVVQREINLVQFLSQSGQVPGAEELVEKIEQAIAEQNVMPGSQGVYY